MYVAVTGKGKSRVIQLREDKRIPGTGKKKITVIETIGNYETLLAQDPDVLEKWKEEAKRRTLEKKLSEAPITLTLQHRNIHQAQDASASFHFGHCLITQLWKQMKLDAFFDRHCEKKNQSAIKEAVLSLLLQRMMHPSSVHSSWQKHTKLAGMSEVGLDVYYQALDVLEQLKQPLEEHCHRFFRKAVGRTNQSVYYDVTTYAFESVRQGELRRFGFSKDHKHQEVQVVMGLLIDEHAIPITFTLFPGCTMDQKTMKTSLQNLKDTYGLHKVTVIADRGLNAKENLCYLLQEGHDFALSYTLKTSPAALQESVLLEQGWKDTYDGDHQLVFREKVIDQHLQVKIPLTREEQESLPKKRGRKPTYKTVEIPVSIHVTWSASRAQKDRSDRLRMLGKLQKDLEKPYLLKSSLKRGRNQYLCFDLAQTPLSIDEEKLQRQERWDGYYAVITNNKRYCTQEICEMYAGLWQIEESFRILKTDLAARPVYVRTTPHIQGHFTLCFLALSLMRYAQYLFLRERQKRVSAAELMQSFEQPTVLVSGEYPNCLLLPTNIPPLYLEFAELLSMPPLKTAMTLQQFKTSTKLDININLTSKK